MAINSKTSQNGSTMYVRPRADRKDMSSATTNPDGSIKTKSGMSTIVANVGKQNSEDAIGISAGDDFYEVFKNESIENALIEKGFSQFRPELIGSFEFIPPLSDFNIEDDSTDVLFNCSASGELIDMSTQLKQLRYEYMLYFLESKLGITKEELLSWGSPGTTSLGDDSGLTDEHLTALFKDWKDHLITFANSGFGDAADASGEGTIAALLDYLAAALSIYDLEEALEVKVNAYNGGDFSASLPAMLNETTMGRYSDEWVTNKAPGVISFESYIKDVLHASPEYWDTVSNTALVTQLMLDAVVRTVNHPSRFYRSDASISSMSPGFLPGHKVSSQTTSDSSTSGHALISQLGKIDINFMATKTYSTAEYTDGHHPFDGDDFMEFWEQTVNQKDPSWLNYIFRDYMTYLRDKGADSGAWIPDQDTGDRGGGVSAFLGFDPFTSYSNIADIPDVPPTAGGFALRGAMWNGPLQAGGPMVAPFNFGGDTPAGSASYSIVPGKEFLLDGFWQDGSVSETLDKLSGLASSLQTGNAALQAFITRSLYTHPLGTESVSTDITIDDPDSSYDQTESFSTTSIIGPLIGFSDASDGAACAASPLQIVFQDLADWLETYYMGPTVDGGIHSAKYTEMSSLLCAMACSMDAGCAYNGFRVAMLRDRARNRASEGRTSGKTWAEDLVTVTYDLAMSIQAYLGSGYFDWTDDATPTSEGTADREYVYNAQIIYIGNGYDGDEAIITETDDVWEASQYVNMADVEGSSDNQIGSSLGFGGSSQTFYDGDEDAFISCDYNGSWFPLMGAWDLYQVANWMNEDIFQAEGVYGLMSDAQGGTRDSYYADSSYEIEGDMGDNSIDEYSQDFETDILDSNNIFDLCYSAVDKFDKVCTAAYLGPEVAYGYQGGVGGNDTRSDTSLSRDTRALGCYVFMMALLQQTQKAAVIIPMDENGYARHYFSMSKRGVKSLIDAAGLINESQSTINETLSDSQYAAFDDEAWPVDGSGYSGAIEEAIALFKTFYALQLEWDIMALNSAFFYSEIVRTITNKVNEIISTFASLGASDADINSIVANVDTDADLKDLILSTTTKEQVTLARYLEVTLAGQNEEYPYLPASKAVTKWQGMMLGSLSQAPGLLQTETSGKKRIFSIGLPLGLIDFLRKAASRELSNPLYNESNIIKISLWRRNLINELEEHLPQEFVFDMSKFVIDGAKYVGTGIDPSTWHRPYSDAEFTSSQFSHTFKENFDAGDSVSFEDALSMMSVFKITPLGPTTHYTGQAFDDDVIDSFDGFESDSVDNLIDVMGNASMSEDHKNVFKQIYNNHVLDWYYKTYLKLTSGIDVGEDNFTLGPHNEVLLLPMGEGDDPEYVGDLDKLEVYSYLKQISASLFSDRDMADSINFERLMGEIGRSFMCSPVKYLKRVVFPKIFDRVFCRLVDEADWGTEAPADQDDAPTTDVSGLENLEDAAPGSYAVATANVTDPTYHQYYVTVSIMTELEDQVYEAT